jgi:hypothetical protein
MAKDKRSMGENRDKRHLTVSVRPRQTRVAYLIDPTNTPVELLTVLFSSSMSYWGGRLFPIVPVVDGVISAEYWSLLRRIDPDWIYSYTALPQTTVDQLLKQLNPLAVERHSDHLLTGNHPHYFPSLDHRLVKIHRLLQYAVEMRWFRKPSLVTYKTKQGKTDPLIARNFGILRSDVLGEPIPEGIAQWVFDDSETFATLLEKLAEIRDSVIFPFAASASHAVVDTGLDSHETTYTIFVGDDLDSWVAFWNHIFTLGAGVRDIWKMFCLPATALEDAATIEALTKFFRRYAYRNGNHPPYINWTSSTLTEEQLKALTAPFVGKKLDAYFRYSHRAAWSFPDMRSRERYSFGFRGNGGLGTPELFGATAHQISSSGGLVNAPGLPFATGHDEHWMQDIRIEYVADYPYYANEDLQYQLPQRSDIAPLFSALPGRVDLDGGLTLLTERRAPLFIKIPEDRSLILAAIGCGRRSSYDGDLQRRDLGAVYRDHGPSDKARYCRGVLNLFEGIQSAHHTFQIRFWKDIFYYLAGLGGREANMTTGIVYQSIAKYPERWTLDPALPKDEEAQRIEREITKLAQYVRVRENEVTFQFLERKLREEREEFRRVHPSISSETVDADAEAAEVRADLRKSLQGFVEAKILRQGINSRCRHCGSKIWQDVSSFKQEFTCVGCGAPVHSAVESTWYYRLNSLLRSGIVEHGTVALIAALAQAREEAKNSFIYSPGLEFYQKYEDKSPTAEIDAICLVDGKVWVGEVKTNAAEFKPKEIEKLLRETVKLAADKAFVFALEGNQDALHRRCENAAKTSGIEIVHLYPSSWGLGPSFHI